VVREEIISILREFKNEYAEEWGIIALGVFGSVARGKADESSDIDVVVRLQKSDLFMLVGIRNELEERLKLSVDIVTYRDAMNQFLKTRIDREALYV
jgi:predicted nucleotidyltransferase